MRGVLYMCGAAALVAGVRAGLTARMPIAYGPGDLTNENERWNLMWFDDFKTDSVTSGDWAPRFEGWAGYPPAPFADGNVEVNTASNQARVFARYDTGVTAVDDGCPCPYGNYTSGIMHASSQAPGPASGGFAQVFAQMPDAPVRFSIWLQSDASELAVFECTVKDTNGNYASSFNVGGYTFDDSHTLDSSRSQAVNIDGGARTLVNTWHTYGVAWRGDSVTMYLDGVPQASFTVDGLESGATSGYKLNIDVSIKAGNLPSPESLPAFARIGSVHMWSVVPLDNYRQLHGQPVCDPSSGGAKRASIRGLSGADHTVADCAAGCDEVFDCKYFTIRITGWCFFFEECEPSIDHGDSSVIFERLVLPEPPEVSPLDSYYLENPADYVPSGQNHDGTARACNGGMGAGRADRSSLGGGGHTPETCAEACSAQDSCNFFVSTSAGYCKMWFSCEPEQTVSQEGSTLYKKKQYQFLSLQERCDKNFNTFVSLGGGGHSREACEIGCEENVACGHYVWYASSGYCHMFTGTCEIVDEAKDGSQYYGRVGGAQIPIVQGFTYTGEVMCDNGGDGNVRATPFSLGGGGHTFLACSKACMAEPTCNYFQRYTSGYCHMWESCPTQTGKTRGTLPYSRDSARRERRGNELSAHDAQHPSASMSFVLGVAGVGCVLLVLGAVAMRRAVAHKPTPTFDEPPMEQSYVMSIHN
eukprot:m.34747 g.34747  ORF g.34747 m.34747 type:complete len:700 (-) comp5183_c0_seq1:65-2164(-)